MKIENVKLAFACDKEWNSMKTCTDGRHCKFCDKTIIDFTDKSIEEFQAIYSASNGKVCGKFNKSQLAVIPSQRHKFIKRILATIFLTIGINLFSREIFAQNETQIDTGKIPNLDEVPGDFIGTIVEQMPVYKYGAEKGLSKFLLENIKYPHDTVEGRVYVTFIIDTAGQVRRPKILRGLTAETDADALRVVKLLEFYPAMRNGKKVAINYNLPIVYSLDKKRKSK